MRSSPMSQAAEHDFVTICISHYCEKARWALDLGGLDYAERGYMPMLHFAGVGLRGRGAADSISSPFSTPKLRHRDGRRWTSSSDIARYAMPSLFEDPDADAFDRDISERFGAHTRRIVYWFTLDDTPRLVELARRNVSPAQTRLFSALVPMGSRIMKRSLGVSAEGYRRSVAATEAVCDRVESMLEDGREYLVGDQFSIADLTFASLLAVLVSPREYGAHLFSVDELDGEFREVVEQYRARPAGQFALRMFRDHRNESL